MSTPLSKPAAVAAGLFVLLSVALPARAQRFSLGVEAGVPLTDFTSTPNGVYQNSINRYAIGATVEARLPWNLAIAADGIYRHYGYAGGPYLENKTNTGDWEIPLLLKYRFHGKAVRPFVNAGFAIDTLSGTNQSTVQSLIWMIRLGETYTVVSSDPYELRRTTVAGLPVGGGIDARLGRLHVQPEIRFTRWNGKHFQDYVPGPTRYFVSNQNQVEFLVGVTF